MDLGTRPAASSANGTQIVIPGACSCAAGVAAVISVHLLLKLFFSIPSAEASVDFSF